MPERRPPAGEYDRAAVRLYHVPQTRATYVLWLLEEIGAPYDLTVLAPDDRKTPEHRARHPLGRVPVIEEEGGYVFESAAIFLHLADLHPEAGLIPPVGTHERALVYQWVLFSMTELEPPLLEAAFSREPDSERSEAARARFREAAGVIESALEGRDLLVGDRFTVADLACGGKLMLGKRFGLIDGLPRVEGYVERLAERPARQRALAVGAPASAA